MSVTLAFENYGSNSEKIVYFVKEDGLLTPTHAEQKSARLSLKSSVEKFFKSAFLPQGYPDSVSNDYLEYQLWDTMQAFCSSITGTLATQAVLKGYGVGDEKATAAAATITWMLKDGAGMIGRILFAWMKGTQLDCDAKRWRLCADILNDCAILLDLIAPIFKSYFLLIACTSSIARSIVSVAGGATRAALTLHQAQRDNMADVSAKDGSQETLVNLMALIAGFIITPMVADKQYLVWIFFFTFTFLHLYANYSAVSAVVMNTINMPRLHILMKKYLTCKEILDPLQVSYVDPVLRGPGYRYKINVGAPLHKVIKSHEDFKLATSKASTYLVGFDRNIGSINIVLHEDVTGYDIRKSCFHALLLDILLQNKQLDSFCTEYRQFLDPIKHGLDSNNDDMSKWHVINGINNFMETTYKEFEEKLKNSGWDLDRCHLGLDEWRVQWDKKIM